MVIPASPVNLDWTSSTPGRLGEVGLDLDSRLEERAAELRGAIAALEARRGSPDSWLGWMDLPSDTALAARIDAWALPRRARFRDVLLLGIGGSALGPAAVATALAHPRHDLLPDDRRGAPRLHVLDNADPDWLLGTLAVCRPERTLALVISKSGTTAEVAAEWLIVRQWLENERGKAWREHAVAITDPESGTLREEARKAGLETFAIPRDVGGRFSVLSPVGLVPLSLVGIGVEELLEGARAAQANLGADLADNAAARGALVRDEWYRAGRRNWVMMPYSHRLRLFSDWWAQLVAESLGKARTRSGQTVNAGATPIKALGVTDQHSQVQLYNEGPEDKLVTFLRLETFAHRAVIPKTGGPNAYLGGHDLAELMAAEAGATEHALTGHGRPAIRWSLRALDGRSVGGVLQHAMIEVALLGELWDVDAFDQPGVEDAKVFTQALLGHPGRKDVARRLAAEGLESER
jgi:glucose-6-phosphate isomerase